MSFHFTRRKPIKEQKLLDTILIPLAKVVDGLMSWWKAPQVIKITDTKRRVAVEETWVSSGGRKTLCINILYVAKVHKSHT